MESPVVFSSSAIAAYKRCPASYKYGYEMLLEPPVPEYVDQGSSFHAHAASYARQVSGKEYTDLPEDDMYQVWREYWLNAPGWSSEVEMGIRMIEEPLYTEIIPGVYIRTTFDLVYERYDGTIVARDYKTFAKAPTLDLDLDFQGRIYIAALQRRFPDRNIEFEYEYVRRVVPGTSNSKGVWNHKDCYFTFPLVISQRESETVWTETQWAVEAMLESKRSLRFWRTDLKGTSPFTCGSCFYKHICKAELEHGELTEQDLAILAPNKKEPITLPKDFLA